MRTRVAEPAGCTGPVVAGILAVGSAEDVLRFAFPEALHRRVPLHVVITAAEAVAVREPIDLWAGKFPDVPLVVAARGGIDAAIRLAAAARRSSLLVTAEPAGPRDAAVLRAVARRVRCPLYLVGGELSESQYARAGCSGRSVPGTPS